MLVSRKLKTITRVGKCVGNAKSSDGKMLKKMNSPQMLPRGSSNKIIVSCNDAETKIVRPIIIVWYNYDSSWVELTSCTWAWKCIIFLLLIVFFHTRCYVVRTTSRIGNSSINRINLGCKIKKERKKKKGYLTGLLWYTYSLFAVQ